jgi:hypothetical protein
LAQKSRDHLTGRGFVSPIVLFSVLLCFSLIQVECDSMHAEHKRPRASHKD